MEPLKVMRRKLSMENEHSYELNPSEPKFTARYLGKKFVLEEFDLKKAYPVTAKYCELLQRESASGRKPRKTELLISKNIFRGLRLTDPTGKFPPETFQLQNIAFCSTYKQDLNVFTFIAEQKGKLECHAFICSKPAKAKAICLALSRAFMTAHDDWTRQRDRAVKKKETQQEVAKIQTNYTQEALKDGNENQPPNYSLATEDDLYDYENDSDVIKLLQGDCSLDD